MCLTWILWLIKHSSKAYSFQSISLWMNYLVIRILYGINYVINFQLTIFDTILYSFCSVRSVTYDSTIQSEKICVRRGKGKQLIYLNYPIM